MRVLCVGRHAFLSEHLCRVFRDAGAECEPAVGAVEALRRASELEPHAIVCDSDLITTSLLDSWAADPALGQVPVLAVSLTRRPEESTPADLFGLAAVLYLPSIERDQIAALLAGLHRPRGVTAPPAWRMSAPAASVHTG
jgi:DNA-binding response OmpR family regulator